MNSSACVRAARCDQTLVHGGGVADEMGGHDVIDDGLLSGGERIGRRLFRGGEKPQSATAELQDAQGRGAGKPSGLLGGGGADHRDGHHGMWLLQQERGSERGSVGGQGGIERFGAEVVGEGEGQPEHAGQLSAEDGRPQEPHFGQIPVAWCGRRVGGRSFKRRQVVDQFHHVIGEAVRVQIAAAAQRPGGDLIGTGGTPETQIDAARMQRFQRPELLGNDQRRMVGEHDPARADPDGGGGVGHMSDDHRRR